MIKFKCLPFSFCSNILRCSILIRFVEKLICKRNLLCCFNSLNRSTSTSAKSSGSGTGVCRLTKITLRNHEQDKLGLLNTMTTLYRPWTYELPAVSARGTFYPWANRGVTSSWCGNSLDFICVSLPSLKCASPALVPIPSPTQLC